MSRFIEEFLIKKLEVNFKTQLEFQSTKFDI